MMKRKPVTAQDEIKAALSRAVTNATSKYTVAGALKKKQPKPITLAPVGKPRK